MPYLIRTAIDEADAETWMQHYLEIGHSVMVKGLDIYLILT